jgi:ATP-dependent Lhr-like helicase
MELSGEILAGYFFENIPGLQFISFDALALLRKRMPEEAIYWFNATDPVSLCGMKIDGLKSTLPPRNATTVVVFHGSKKVIVARATFKRIDIFVPPDAPSLPDYFSFFKEHLSRQFNPVKRVSIETINGENPLKSAYLPAFKRFGFTTNYKGLELWRSFDGNS